MRVLEVKEVKAVSGAGLLTTVVKGTAKGVYYVGKGVVRVGSGLFRFLI